MEMKCTACGGTGNSRDPRQDCSACKGFGVVPTKEK